MTIFPNKKISLLLETKSFDISETRKKKHTPTSNISHSNLWCNFYSGSQKLETQFAGEFIEKLAQTCETMLLQFDAVLSLDDVEVGSKLLNYMQTRV